MTTTPASGQPAGIRLTNRTVQTIDTIRRNNLSMILTALHRSGPLSRAQLTRSTGFNRSTISALVAELAENGLAFETMPNAGGRVGRPSPLVHANENVAALVIAPDIDAVSVGLVGLGGTIHRRIRHEVSQSPSIADAVEVSAAVIDSLAPDLAGMHRIAGVGVAVPGLVRETDGQVLLAPRLAWKDESITAPLRERLGYPVHAANDASLGALAESLYGAAAGISDAIYLNGSPSGIGGGVITGGRPLRGTAGYAGELGHTVVRSGGDPCHCGRTGCLETEVKLDRLLDVLGLDHADPEALERAVAPLGDDRAGTPLRGEVERQLDMLGIALTDFANIFNPHTIVLGGFLGTLYGADPERLTGAVQAGAIAGLGSTVDIRRAVLRSELLLVGAAELAFSDLLSDPLGAPR